MTPKPWGKIAAILLMAAGVMGVFVWKYLDMRAEVGEDQLGYIHPILKPFYAIFGDALFLVFGAVAAVLFAAVGLRAVIGKPDTDS